MKDQIDRMKRSKKGDDDLSQYFSDEGGDSLEQPTIKNKGTTDYNSIRKFY